MWSGSCIRRCRAAPSRGDCGTGRGYTSVTRQPDILSMTDKPPADGPRTPKKRATAKVMKRARTVQLSMLPKMPAIEGLDLHAHYAPCEAVGGDFYDFVPVSPWEIGIVMGDVAGH